MASNQPSAAGPPAGEQRPKRTRRRLPVSCTLCHTRKLKCNRQTPCSSCEMRGEASKCVYAKHVDEQQHGAKRRRTLPKDEELQQRLDNIERLIVDAASGRAQSIHSESNATSEMLQLSSPNSTSLASELQGAPQVGSFDKNGPHPFYAGDTAFNGVLQEVSEVALKTCVFY